MHIHELKPFIQDIVIDLKDFEVISAVEIEVDIDGNKVSFSIVL